MSHVSYNLLARRAVGFQFRFAKHHFHVRLAPAQEVRTQRRQLIAPLKGAARVKQPPHMHRVAGKPARIRSVGKETSSAPKRDLFCAKKRPLLR